MKELFINLRLQNIETMLSFMCDEIDTLNNRSCSGLLPLPLSVTPWMSPWMSPWSLSLTFVSIVFKFLLFVVVFVLFIGDCQVWYKESQSKEDNESVIGGDQDKESKNSENTGIVE